MSKWVDRVVLAVGVGILIVFVSVMSLGAQVLIERDSESWGLPYGGVRLPTKLVTQVGRSQRFNPAVVAGRMALTNVKLYVDVPTSARVQESRAWVKQNGTTYRAELGRINPGEAINAHEAMHFTPFVAGTLRIPYLISAAEIRPRRGVISVTVTE